MNKAHTDGDIYYIYIWLLLLFYTKDLREILELIPLEENSIYL